MNFEWTQIEKGLPPVLEDEVYVNVFVVVKSKKDDRGFAERQGNYFLPSKFLNQTNGSFQLSNGVFYWDDDIDILAWALVPEYRIKNEV